MDSQSGAPLVTILVPTFNRETFLQKTLNSIKNIPGTRVIVINDGGRPVKVSDESIELINLPTNVGEAEVVNIGWSMANTKYFSVISDDDPQSEKWLQPLLKEAERNPNYVAYYPNTVVMKSNSTTKIIKARKYSKQNFLNLLRCPCLAGVLINRELLESFNVKTLRVKGMKYPNDLIQWLELSKYGNFLPVKQSTSYWWVHQDQLSNSLTNNDQAIMYYKNVRNWQIKSIKRKSLTSAISITLLRSLQIAVSRKSGALSTLSQLLKLHIKSLSTSQAAKSILFIPFLAAKLIIFKALND